MHIACCGLDCEICEAFIATQRDDDVLRAEIAKQWSEHYGHPFKPEDIYCMGCCCGGKKIEHCNSCEIRLCCKERNIPNCGACEDFVCETLEKFYKLFPDGGEESKARLISQRKI